MAKKVYIGVNNFEKVTLPSGYTQVECIQSDGAQYIDIGFKPNQDTRVVMDADIDGGNDYPAPFGAWTTANSESFIVLSFDKANQTMFFYGNNSSTVTNMSIMGRHQIDANKNQLYIDDTLALTMSATTFTTDYSLYLFTMNENNAPRSMNMASMKLYSCQIYDNGTLVRNFIPCKNASGTVGLYDLVNSKFYTNAGTGALTAGSSEQKSVAKNVKQIYVGVEQKLPSGYTQVKYLQSSGTQWINTQHNVQSQNIRYICRMAYTGDNSNGVSFGGGSVGEYVIAMYKSTPAFWVGKSESLCQITMETNVFHTLEIRANNGTFTVIRDGVSQTDTYSGTMSSANPISLFAQYASGRGDQFASIAIEYFKIYDNDVLVRNYVPCKNASGTAGLYDLANNVFYTNAGSGTFATGATVTAEVESVARRVKKGYIGIGGVARPFWGYGKLEYYGTISGVVGARYDMAGTTVGNYALIAGGNTANTNVGAYNDKLTYSAPTSLSVGRRSFDATTVGNYAIFAGGFQSTVDTYNTSLTRGSATQLNGSCHALAATTVGNYALFAGGQPAAGVPQAVVCAYNASLTKSNPTQLSQGRAYLSATTVGDYALITGGENSNSTPNPLTTVDAYNSSLTRSTPTALSVGKTRHASTTVGDYALIGGGYETTSGNSAIVNAYNKSLTRSVITSLSAYPTVGLDATTVKGFALFCSGEISFSASYKVDVYDESLTHSVAPDLKTGHGDVTAVSVGNYAIFTGGNSSDGQTEAYVVR